MSKTCIIVSHTHWDREWYEPYQRFRMRLVRLMDNLLCLLESNPDFPHFLLDGQTIILEDYLEIRPQSEAALGRLIERGRLHVGPWYVLPDEFLVSGEALVRNLLLGERVARRFGPKMRVGYTPDAFGHISQLPQILLGFGIDSAVLTRGLGDEPTELLWQAPDGSMVLLCHLRDHYDNAAHLAWHDSETLAAELTRVYDSLAAHSCTEYALLMNGTDHMEPTAELPLALQKVGGRLPELRLVHGSLRMYLDAVKEALQLDLTQPEDTLKARLPILRGELRSSKRHHLLPGVLSSRMWIKQRNHQIENLLEKWAEPFSALAEVVANAGICQYDAIEALMATAANDRKDEVCATTSATPIGDGRGEANLAPTPGDAARRLLLQAWRYLLQNQAHDSICGCSIDQAHREMATRFDWADQIASQVAAQALAQIAAAVNTQRQATGEPGTYVPLVVFNPHHHPRTDTVTLNLQLPGSLERFKVVDERGQAVAHQGVLRKGPEFASLDLDCQEIMSLRSMVERVAGMGLVVREVQVSGQGRRALIDVTLMSYGRTDPQLVARAQQQVERLLAEGQTKTFHVRAYLASEAELCLVAEDVPGCGYRTYFLVQAPDVEPDSAVESDGSARPGLCHVSATECSNLGREASHLARRMENAFLRVDVDPSDGTVSLQHRPSGVNFTGLHRFVDGGDRGDEYNYCPPEADCLISRPTSPPQIRWLEQGPARWTIEVKQSYRVPASLAQGRAQRCEDGVDIPITTRMHLSPGVPRLDVHTEIQNRACDHRLRVHFPTPLRASCSEADGTFDVVQRPLGLPPDSGDWAEQPVATFPERTFVDVSDGQTGLMVANRGLPEYEVLSSDSGETTIALTLLRCVGWLSRDDLPCRPGNAGPSLETPEAQCLGCYAFDYALVPHEGTWRHAYHQAHAFDAPLWAVAADAHAGAMASAQSLLDLRGEGLVLSSVKATEAGDGLVVRFYNTQAGPATAVLRAIVPPRTAALVTLAEEPIAPLDVGFSGAVTLQAQGRQIVTVKLTF